MNTQTFNIALPKELVKEVDRTAKQEYKNRSELIRGGRYPLN
ncbi:MAG: ribbon-helix-helix protein, CopG family [Candidatus Staskawiczbacteria bacterium]|nr:ribbon-helix-helix protein, CopG family [Candidatus Staskawiczbacteria bacterium]